MALVPDRDVKESRKPMNPHVLLHVALCLVACSSAHAEYKKCTDTLGKVIYSDLACSGESVALRPVNVLANTFDGAGLRVQVQKDALERERIAQEELSRRLQQVQANEKSSQAEAAAYKAAAANTNCVRAVERQGATENVKAELFTACRTAGQSQRQTGLTEAALRDCVLNVDRTGASSNDKARQIAICHGADVKPNAITLLPAATFNTAK